MLLILAVVLGVAGIVGLAAAPLLQRSPGLHALGVAFAAGTLLTLTLVHILPEAMAHAHGAGALFVVGFVGMMLMQQKVLKADPCCGHEHGSHAALPSYLAMTFCSINDGILVSGEIAHGLASPLLWAMALHKVTASFALVVLLQQVAQNQTLRARIVYLTLFVLVTPITMLAAAELSRVTTVMPYVMALSGGALLYVIAGSLVPRVEHVAREGNAPVLGTFLAAVLLNVGLELLGPAHGHAPA